MQSCDNEQLTAQIAAGLTLVIVTDGLRKSTIATALQQGVVADLPASLKLSILYCG